MSLYLIKKGSDKGDQYLTRSGVQREEHISSEIFLFQGKDLAELFLQNCLEKNSNPELYIRELGKESSVILKFNFFLIKVKKEKGFRGGVVRFVSDKKDQIEVEGIDIVSFKIELVKSKAKK